jgi:hypothetical protein
MANMDMIFTFKMQAKTLEKQALKEQRNAEKERRIARQHLAKGERAFADHHAQASCRAKLMAEFYLKNSGAISSMVADMQMAQIQKGMAKALGDAAKKMDQYIGKMDLAKIAETTLQYDKLRGKVGTAHSLVAPTDESVEVGANALVESLLDELDTEQMLAMGEIPGSVATGEAAKTSAAMATE